MACRSIGFVKQEAFITGLVFAAMQKIPTQKFPAGDDLLVVPVEARGTRWGALIALPGEPHPAGRSAVLEQGTIALALGRLADRDGDEWLRISHQHLLDALLEGRYASSAGVAARLEAARLPVAGRMLIGLVVEDRDRALTANAIPAVTAAAFGIGGRAIAGMASNVAGQPAAQLAGQLAGCLSVPSDARLDDRQVRRFARAFAASARVDESGLSVGVGAAASDVSGLLGSLQESLELLSPPQRSQQRGLMIRRAQDRLLLSLVTALRDDPRVQEHAQRVLGPLIDYDLNRGGDLLAILAAVLAHPTSRTVAARASHLSRSVFYQRIKLIADLLGADLTDGETLASLHVAMLAAGR